MSHRAKDLFPKCLTPTSLKLKEVSTTRKKSRFSVLNFSRSPTVLPSPKRPTLPSPYDGTARQSVSKHKRKMRICGLNSRRTSAIDPKHNGSLTPTQMTPSPWKMTDTENSEPRTREGSVGSMSRARRYTRSPSPTFFTLPISKPEDRYTITLKSKTPDPMCLLEDSSDENIIQTPAEEDSDIRLSPVFAYSKILEHSINSYMNCSRSKLGSPKSQNTLMATNQAFECKYNVQDRPRGSEAEPEPSISTHSSQIRSPDDSPKMHVGTSGHPTSPLIRRITKPIGRDRFNLDQAVARLPKPDK